MMTDGEVDAAAAELAKAGGASWYSGAPSRHDTPPKHSVDAVAICGRLKKKDTGTSAESA
jgi:hypothetical protein